MYEALSGPEEVSVTLGELRNAARILSTIGIDLTEEQQKMLDLYEELIVNFEGVFHRFRDRIQRLGFDEKAQEIFHSFLKGVLLLEGEKVLIEQCLRVDDLDDESLSLGIESFVQQTPELLDEFQVGTLIEAFEMIKEKGKSKVYVWNYASKTYQLLEPLTKEQLSVLPWGGKIQIDGPQPLIQATFQIKDHSYEFGFARLFINGIAFTLHENEVFFSTMN